MALTCSRGFAFALCLLGAGCSLPRGAALESEVLAAQGGGQAEGEAPDFAVYSVTRATLPVLSGWPATGPQPLNWIRRQEQPASMIIAAGDTVSVTVWDAEENSLLAGPGQRLAQLQDVQVSSGGSIFLPFLGDMHVAGMAPSTARERIEERYAETIPSVQVQLTVAPGRANTANLVSGVTNPGIYPLPDRDFTVLGLLSQGGGVLAGLRNPQVRLFRGRNSYGISVDRLFADPALDTTLQGGDRVIVASDERYFLSLGAAGTEAQHIFPHDRVTALDAMSIIGGVSDDRADLQGILILREYPQSAVHGVQTEGPPQTRMVFTVDLTTTDGLFSAGRFPIMAGDLVYVTESPVNAARTVLGILGTTVGLAQRL